MTRPQQIIEEDGTKRTILAPGEEIVEVPLSKLSVAPVEEPILDVERMARDFLSGKSSIGDKKKIRNDLEAKVVAKIGAKGGWMVDKLFELIDGVYIVEKGNGKNRDIRYYQRPPDLEAIKYAIDRILGRPTQHVETNDEKSGIVTVEHVIKQMARDPYGKKKEVIDAEFRS